MKVRGWGRWDTDEQDALDLDYTEALVNGKAANILVSIFSGEPVVITDDEFEDVEVIRGCCRRYN